MGFYKYLRDMWKKPNENMREEYKKHLIQWRKQPVTVRAERPTRIDRARTLGYRAKQGFLIVRQRVNRGGRKREQVAGGRRPKHYRKVKVLDINYQHVAEMRAAVKYKNCEVLNSYFVGKDGQHYWYEIIMVDKSHPVVKKDQRIKWITQSQHKGRAHRGITSAARKSRGLRKKGKGAEKVR